MKKTAMKNVAQNSPLEQAQGLKHGGEQTQKKRSELAVALPLTSLIDAFSIIVIYLLIGTQSATVETKVSDKMQLPMAESGLNVDAESKIVRIENGAYFIDDVVVAEGRLGEKLNELRLKLLAQNKDKEVAIMIQADQAMDYAALDPLLRAGSEAGIQKLKFAVIPKQ